jgi:hypothetical protein
MSSFFSALFHRRTATNGSDFNFAVTNPPGWDEVGRAEEGDVQPTDLSSSTLYSDVPEEYMVHSNLAVRIPMLQACYVSNSEIVCYEVRTYARSDFLAEKNHSFSLPPKELRLDFLQRAPLGTMYLVNSNIQIVRTFAEMLKLTTTPVDLSTVAVCLSRCCNKGEAQWDFCSCDITDTMRNACIDDMVSASEIEFNASFSQSNIDYFIIGSIKSFVKLVRNDDKMYLWDETKMKFFVYWIQTRIIPTAKDEIHRIITNLESARERLLEAANN